MGKLLKFEFRKITRQKSFYICFGIALLILALSAVILKAAVNEAGSTEVFSPVSFSLTALTSSSFTLVLGIFVALYCCADYSDNTLKNIYSRGYTRAQVYFAKYLVSLLLSLAVAILFFLWAFIFGKKFGNTEEAVTQEFIISVVCQLVIVAGYHAVYFSLAMIIGKVGGSVAVNLVGPMLVITVLTLLTSLLKIENLTLNSYWLDAPMSSLSQGAAESSLFLKSIVMSVIYAGIFVAGGYFLNRKKEI